MHLKGGCGLIPQLKLSSMFNSLTYFGLIAIARITSIFPLFLIHGISDLISLIAYYIVRYRRKVVRVNLKHSFPDKNISEIISIEKRFYRYFTDYFMETMMSRFISEKRLSRHFVYKNAELINSYFVKNRSIILVTAHLGSFEMSLQMPKFIRHKVMAVYKPQSNKGFDMFFVKLRERCGIEAVPMNAIGKRIYQNVCNNTPSVTYLLSDQRPDRLNVRYWTMFLNQETPVLLGPERLSVKYNQVVLFLSVKRIKRSFYEASFELIEDNPQTTKEYEITEKLTRHLEKLIKADPSIYFWTHRRWKHRRFIDFIKMVNKTPDSPGVAYNHDLIHF